MNTSILVIFDEIGGTFGKVLSCELKRSRTIFSVEIGFNS
jgi:hypothetical protein